MARSATALLLLLALASAAALAAAREVPPGDDARVRQVIETASLTGRVEGVPFALRGRLFEYLVDHPDVATHAMQALGFGRYRVWREADGLWADDGGGARGRLWLVGARAGHRVAFLEGRYKAPLLPAIKGRVVVVLEYAVARSDDGRDVITPTLTAHVKIDNVLVEMASRLVRAVAAAKAERLARRIVADFTRTARVIDEDPARVREALGRRAGVPPADLEAFGRLLAAR